jgi:RNA polymerase sigma-70 factor (ECF subfamily)
MPDPATTTGRLGGWLDRLRAGDPDARAELTRHAEGRLRRLAARALRRHPELRGWEETDDLVQAAALRLHRALAEVTPELARHLLALAVVQVRRQLIDLLRAYFGPHGFAAHQTVVSPTSRWTAGPEDLAGWTAFHEAVARLPPELGEVVDLLWYQGLSQPEAAQLLGVSARTLKRRWRDARVALFDALDGTPPSP